MHVISSSKLITAPAADLHLRPIQKATVAPGSGREKYRMLNMKVSEATPHLNAAVLSAERGETATQQDKKEREAVCGHGDTTS